MKNKKLAEKIIQLAKRDQKIRKAYLKNPAFLGKLKKLDQLNLAEMKKIIKTFGWPTISLVGKRASHSAWLLVHHAVSDPKFQKRCLNLLKKAVDQSEALPKELAYLTDRVLVNSGKPQLYGTQFYYDGRGKLLSRPIKNQAKLNQRRKSVGLESFEEYERKLERQVRRSKV